VGKTVEFKKEKKGQNQPSSKIAAGKLRPKGRERTGEKQEGMETARTSVGKKDQNANEFAVVEVRKMDDVSDSPPECLAPENRSG